MFPFLCVELFPCFHFYPFYSKAISSMLPFDRHHCGWVVLNFRCKLNKRVKAVLTCILDVLYRSFERTDLCFHVTIKIKSKTNSMCVDHCEGCISPEAEGRQLLMSANNHRSSQNMPAMLFVAFAAFGRRVSGAFLSDHLTEWSGSSKQGIELASFFFTAKTIFSVFFIFLR